MDFVKILENNGRIKECFFHKKEYCKGKIKSAHSIQRSKKLEVLLGNVDGNQALYSLLHTERDLSGKSIGMRRQGAKEASTFFGFCDYHDSKLFAPIENNDFDESDLHLFLHSFRSFAHSYHTILQNIKMFSKLANEKKIDVSIPISSLKETLFEADRMRNEFQIIFENGNFDDLEYYYIIFPSIFPLASSGGFQPEYTFKGKQLNKPYSPLLNFTLFPEKKGRTICIFSWTPEDKKAKAFIDEIERLKDFELYKLITSLMIAYVENSFISPDLWQSLSKNEKRQLLWEIDNSDPENRIKRKKFWKSELNFFKPDYILQL